MAVITVEEYERIPLGEGEAQLPPAQAQALVEQWTARTGTDPANFFEFGGRWLKPKGWTGVVPGATTLEVLPRGAKALGGPARSVLDRNLGQMFALTLGGSSLTLEQAELSAAGTTYERAAEALCDSVLRARRHQRIRSYVRRQEDSHTARGRIRFPDQVFVSLRRPGLFASQWVELTEDVPVNRFLRAVLELLTARVSGRVRRRIDDALVELDGATRSDAHLEYGRIKLDRLPVEYVRAVELGKALLDGEMPGLYGGSREGNAGVLILPRLFDDFVSRITSEAATSIGQRGRMKVKGRFLAEWANGPYAGSATVEVIPDAEVTLAGQTTLLVDAKWKRLNQAWKSFNIEAGDVHQMLAYGVRLDCPRALLVYPTMATYPAPGPATLRAGGSSSRVVIDIVQLPLLWRDLSEPVKHLAAAMAA